jgi:pSer/pThr/pTyr-binding forkhead associated (FHA) protein
MNQESDNNSISNQNAVPMPGRDEKGSGIPAIGKCLLIVQSDPGQSIEVDLSGTEGYVIGRSDSKSSYMPDIDLARYQALDKGVSRRHAALVRYQGYLQVIDLSSVNGTFINGNRLTPETAYPLRPDDQLTLGELNLAFSQMNKNS